MANMDLIRACTRVMQLEDELSELILDELRESGEEVDSAVRARPVLTDDGEVWAEVTSDDTDDGDPDGEDMAYYRFSTSPELVKVLDQGTFTWAGSDPAAIAKVADHIENLIEVIGQMEVNRG